MQVQGSAVFTAQVGGRGKRGERILPKMFRRRSKWWWGTVVAGTSAAAYYIWSEMEKRTKDDDRVRATDSYIYLFFLFFLLFIDLPLTLSFHLLYLLGAKSEQAND